VGENFDLSSLRSELRVEDSRAVEERGKITLPILFLPVKGGDFFVAEVFRPPFFMEL